MIDVMDGSVRLDEDVETGGHQAPAQYHLHVGALFLPVQTEAQEVLLFGSHSDNLALRLFQKRLQIPLTLCPNIDFNPSTPIGALLHLFWSSCFIGHCYLRWRPSDMRHSPLVR